MNKQVSNLITKNPKYLAKSLANITGASWLTKWYISQALTSDDDYPSLLSLKRTLGRIGLSTFATQYPIKDLIRMSPPLPLIAEMETNIRYYVVVKRWKDENVIIYNDGRDIELSLSEFERYSTQKYMVVDWDSQKEFRINTAQIFLSYATKRGVKLSVYTSYLLFLGTIVYLIGKSGIGWLCSALLWLGIILMSTIIIQRKRQPQLHGVCKGDGIFNCNLILDSEASKVTDYLGWGDLGGIYSLFSLFVLLYVPHNQFGLTISTLLFALATFYSLYSLYYQFIKVQIICVHCSCVQGFILWGLTFNIVQLRVFTLNNIDVVDFVILLLLMLWAVGIHYAVNYFQLSTSLIGKEEGKIFRQIKKLPEVLQLQLSHGERLSEIPENCVRISSLNNKDELVLVVNPGCPRCIQELNTLLALREEDLQLSISILWLSGDDRMLSTQRYILSRYYELNKENFGDFLKQFTSKYPASIKECLEGLRRVPPHILKEVDKLNATTAIWAHNNNLHDTPTLLLNRFRLPWFYTIDDIICMHN